MKQQLLIELSHERGTAKQLWERMTVRLRDDVVISGSLHDALSHFEALGYAIGEREGEHRVFTITEAGAEKAKACSYALVCGTPLRVGSQFT